MAKLKKTRKKKFNANKAKPYETYTRIRNIKSDAAFYESLKLTLNSPFYKNKLLPKPSNFKNNISNSAMYYDENNIERDLHTSFEFILGMATELTDYLKIKNEVEEGILSGEYELALENVEGIYKQFGMSYWYLENKFSLLSRLNRDDEIYNYFKEIKGEITEFEEREITLLIEKAVIKQSNTRFEFLIQSILDCVEPESLDYDSVRFIFDFNPLEKYNLGNILRYLLSLNVIDIYNGFIRLTAYSLVNDLEIKDVFLNYSNQLKGNILDLSLCNIHDYNALTFEQNNEFISFCDKYIEGDFESVIEIFNSFDAPLSKKIIYVEFYIKSLIFTGGTPSNDNKGLFGEILTNYFNVIKDDDIKSLLVLEKASFQFGLCEPLSVLFVYKAKVITSNKSDLNLLYRYTDVLVNPHNPFRETLGMNSICSSLNTANLDDLEDKIPKFRFYKFKADNLVENGDFLGALKLYDSITNIPDYLEREIIEKKILLNNSIGNINEVDKIIVSLYLDRNMILKRLPLFEIKEKVLNSKELDRTSINTPIFAHIMKEAGLTNNQKVALLCDDFLYLNGFSTAEEINDINKEIIFLFVNVMTVEVINRQDEKSEMQDDFINRAKLLYKVKDHTEDLQSLIYDVEYLVSQYSRKLCKNDLGKGKINVNADAIKKLSMSQLGVDFNNLISLDLELDFDIPDFEYCDLYFKSKEFILSIRDLYAMHDIYGLENTLNTDIRHNGVVPTLRAVFASNGVICKKSKDEYLENPLYETYVKNVLKNEPYEMYQNMIKDFSKEVDTILNNLKNKYMHIFTNDLDDMDKLFKLTISKEEVIRFITHISENHSKEDAVDFVLTMLKGKTEKAMRIGKETIKVATKSEVDKKILSLIANLRKANNINRPFIEELKHTKNQFEDVTIEVADWLDFTKHSADDFTLLVPITEALDFVKNIYPTITLRVNDQKSDIITAHPYKGDYLVTFIRVFLILFQNAAKSANEQGDCNINVHYEVKNEHCCLIISNNYESTDLNLVYKIQKVLEEGNMHQGAFNESGSGIYKIKKMLNRDLQVDNKLKINVNEEDKCFEVIIEHDINLLRG
jgi:hypothetical protein